MNIINVILTILGSFINIYMEIIICRKISNSDIQFNYKTLLLFILSAILVSINIIYMNNSFLRLSINYIILFITSKIIFKMSISKNLLCTSICFITSIIVEMVYFILLLKINIPSFSFFENNHLIKMPFSIIVFLTTYYILSTRYFLTIIKKLLAKFNNSIILNIIFIIFLIALFIVDIRNSIVFTSQIYFGSIVLIASLLFFVLLSIYNYIRVKKEIEKSEILLDFMKKYEITIDEYRMYKHEVLNDLLTIKSFKNKKTKEFESTLNQIISIYDKKSIGIKNIHKLPSGLKGIFYFKLNGLEKDNFNIRTNISKNITNISNNINHNNYIILCKSIGILLDNAIEAAGKTTEKYIGIDIYENNNSYTISIENSVQDFININKIYNKNYSTKGASRGFGLYILKNLIAHSNDITLSQTINNNIFKSDLIIKNKH